jgi:hypothetical protein
MPLHLRLLLPALILALGTGLGFIQPVHQISQLANFAVSHTFSRRHITLRVIKSLECDRFHLHAQKEGLF